MLEPAAAPAPVVKTGTCYALFAYEVAHAIDLDECERRLTALTAATRHQIRHKRRTPSYFEYRPAPLRVTQEMHSLAVGPYGTAGSVDVLLYDFGAVSVSYTIPFDGPLVDLLALAAELYDNAALLEDSRRRVTQLVADVAPAFKRARIADFVEPYVIFQIEACTGPCNPAVLVTGHAQALAQILRSEQASLSAQEVNDALAARISFGADDLVVIDWDAALVVDRDADDVRDVLEFANVELLEMRYLDQRLDDALDESYEALARRSWVPVLRRRAARADLRRVGQLQVDGALLFENVNNALKLLGEQYLARVYRLASERFHLAEWDASILRKLQTLESIYQKMSDDAATWRMEILEWIIVILIAVSIVIPFVIPLAAH